MLVVKAVLIFMSRAAAVSEAVLNEDSDLDPIHGVSPYPIQECDFKASLSLFFFSLSTHTFPQFFPLLTSPPFTTPFLIMQTWSWCVCVSPISCLISLTDKNGSALIKMAVQKEPQRDSDYLDLSLSLSLSFSVFVDEVGVIHFLT